MIVIVDYGMGNLRSVQKAVEHLGYQALVTSSAQDIISAEKVILPGVGAFGDAMAELEKRGLKEALIECINKGTYFLGICLGIQLLFEKSEESPGVDGLSIFKGTVLRFTGDMKIPHMGWNQIRKTQKECPLLENIPDNEYMYFVHSYYVQSEQKEVVCCETSYGNDFTSMIWKDNVFATQFHPEKSQEKGLAMLKSFCELK